MNLDDLSHWARSDGLQIVLLAIGAVLGAWFVHWLGGRASFQANVAASAAVEAGVPIDERDKRRRAVVQALERAAVALLWFVTVFMVLLRLRVPVTSLVAPATVAGLAIGFGAQRVVGDLLSGFFLLSEDQYGVGDVVVIAQPNQLTATGTVRPSASVPRDCAPRTVTWWSSRTGGSCRSPTARGTGPGSRSTSPWT